MNNTEQHNSFKKKTQNSLEEGQTVDFKKNKLESMLWDPMYNFFRSHSAKDYEQVKLLGPWNDKKKYGSLKRVVGQESISNLFEYTLTLVTENKDIEKETFCNKKLGFMFQKAKSNQNVEPEKIRYCHGIIKNAVFLKEIPHEVHKMYVYQLTLVPHLYQTTQVKRTNIFFKEEQTISDIIKAVLSEYSIEPKFDIKDETLFACETCVQFNETDFEFLTRLMASAGFFYFFEHQESDYKMVISNRATSYFEIDTQVKHYSEEDNLCGIYNLRVAYNSYLKDFDVKVFNYEKCEELVEDKYSVEGHKKQEALSVKSQQMLYMHKVTDKQEVQNIVSSSATGLSNTPEYITGSSGYKSLAVGGKIRLKGDAFDKSLEIKEYVITSLTVDVEDSENSFYQNSFVAIPKDCVVRPHVIKKNFLGPHPAIVVNKEGNDSDEEPFVDKKGQVYTYVRLQWGIKNVCKALVITPFDTVNVPKAGALVNVGFLQNDSYSDIAFVWGMHPPKIEELLDYEQKDHNVLNLYSAFHQGKERDNFNSILFKDKKDEQEVEIRAKGDHYSYIKKTRQSFIGYDKREEIPSKEDSDKEILLLKVGNKKEILCDGNSVLNINKGDVLITLDKGKYNITLTDGDYTLECKKVKIDAKDDIEILSDKNIAFKAKGNITLNADSGLEIKSPKDVKISGNNLTSAAQSSYKVDAMSISQSASQGVNVKAGTELKAEGGIGATLKGGGTVKVEAGAMATVKGAMNQIG
jgi:type VI secretion system secreted protein VgrG